MSAGAEAPASARIVPAGKVERYRCMVAVALCGFSALAGYGFRDDSPDALPMLLVGLAGVVAGFGLRWRLIAMSGSGTL